MPEYEEPTPAKPKISGEEAKKVLHAALGELNGAIYEVRPDPRDSTTIASHIETAIFDSLRDPYAADAIPNLFLSMSEAASAMLNELVHRRGY